MNNFLSKRIGQNNIQGEVASVNSLHRPLALAKIRKIEEKLNLAFDKIQQLKEDVKKIIELRKQSRNKTGGQVMFTKDKELEKALQNLEDIFNKLTKAFEELQLLREEMQGLYKEYGVAKAVAKAKEAVKSIGLAEGAVSVEEEEVESD